MAHALSVVPLRLALAALRTSQPGLPARERAAVTHAAALRLTGAERAVEAAIDGLRQRLAASPDRVEVVDYGAGTRGGRPPVRDVAEIYQRAATGPAWGRFLFGLVRALRPRRVLELGTNLGVGAAHLAGALAVTAAEGGPSGRLVTLEGAPALAERAVGHLRGLGHAVGDAQDDRLRVVVGPFVETLGATAEEEGPFDLVFVDGHHQADAALAYLDALEGHLAPGALVVLDDVEPGRAVREAWRQLRAERPAAPAFYAGKYGLLFAEPGGPRGAAAAVVRETPSLQSEPIPAASVAGA